jgi:hypothetical protein
MRGLEEKGRSVRGVSRNNTHFGALSVLIIVPFLLGNLWGFGSTEVLFHLICSLFGVFKEKRGLIYAVHNNFSKL